MNPPFPRLCYITDRHSLEPRPLLPFILETIRGGGVDLIQIREKDLSTRELLHLAQAVVEGSHRTATRVTVNDRLDVALAVGAQGVHVGVRSMPAGKVRAAVPGEFWLGVSCHSVEDVHAAASAGADYVLLGPVFETESKLRYGPPLGLEALERAARQTSIPVLALGGVTLERVEPCLKAGATGIAGISIFQKAESPAKRVREVREVFDRLSGKVNPSRQ
jgi:thiamine-phosphate pyrophosphorylase